MLSKNIATGAYFIRDRALKALNIASHIPGAQNGQYGRERLALVVWQRQRKGQRVSGLQINGCRYRLRFDHAVSGSR